MIESPYLAPYIAIRVPAPIAVAPTENAPRVDPVTDPDAPSGPPPTFATSNMDAFRAAQQIDWIRPLGEPARRDPYALPLPAPDGEVDITA